MDSQPMPLTGNYWKFYILEWQLKTYCAFSEVGSLGSVVCTSSSARAVWILTMNTLMKTTAYL